LQPFAAGKALLQIQAIWNLAHKQRYIHRLAFGAAKCLRKAHLNKYKE
jgi:hypothetical protein